MSTPPKVRRAGDGLRSPILAIGIATFLVLAVVWLIAVPIGPEACALSLPGQRNCFTSDRVQAAIIPTIAIVAAAILAISLAFALPSKSRLIAVSSVIILLAFAVASYVLVAWIPALAWSWRPGIEL